MTKITSNLYADIRNILTLSRNKAIRVVNNSMVLAYWNIGRLIIDFQGGDEYAKYGSSLMINIFTLVRRLEDRMGITMVHY